MCLKKGMELKLQVVQYLIEISWQDKRKFWNNSQQSHITHWIPKEQSLNQSNALYAEL